MKVRFNITVVIMLVLVAWIVGSQMFQFVDGFQDGFEDGHTSHNDSIVAADNDIMETFIAIHPRDNSHFCDSIYNQIGARYHKVNIRSLYVYSPEADNFTSRSLVLPACFVMLFALIIFWIYFVRVILLVNYDKDIFTRKLEKRLLVCGISLAITGICSLAIDVIDQNVAMEVCQFTDYYIISDKSDSFIMLVIAVGIIMVSQVFGIARRLREEQELTI